MTMDLSTTMLRTESICTEPRLRQHSTEKEMRIGIAEQKRRLDDTFGLLETFFTEHSRNFSWIRTA